MIYGVSLQVGWGPGESGPDPSLADADPVLFRSVHAPGPREAAARAYVAALGRRRSLWLRQSGEPAARCRAEVDADRIAARLGEFAAWRTPLGPGLELEARAYRLPPLGTRPDCGWSGVLLVVSRVTGRAAVAELLRLARPSPN